MQPAATPAAASAEETAQLALWRSEFGRSYTDRNDHAKPERQVSWGKLIGGLTIERALEVGCNVGWNLSYLAGLGVPSLYGIEPQRYAVERARARDPGFGVLQGTAFDLPFKDGWFDLAFTSGVLIHISPDDAPRAMAELYRVSRRYLVAIEYDHPTEVEVAYRGHEGALWKRDHGALWQRLYPSLRLRKRIELHAADGYDDCTAHLFEKAA
jgi:pseudaminic acid biosynthesis-associated methylase